MNGRYSLFLLCFLFNAIVSMERSVWAPAAQEKKQEKRVKKTCAARLRFFCDLRPADLDCEYRVGLTKITLQREYLLRKARRNLRQVINLFFKAYDGKLYDEIIDIFNPLFEKYKDCIKNEVNDEKLINEIEKKIQQCIKNKKQIERYRYYDNNTKSNSNNKNNNVMEQKKVSFLDEAIGNVINVTMEKWEKKKTNKE